MSAKAKANNQPPPDRDRLRRELTRAYEENSLLSPDFELEFDDPAIGVVTVAEVLSDRARFIGQTLADPLEGPTYGRCKALVMEDRFNGGLFIKSFAHGGVGYRLVLNDTMIRAMIERAKPEDAVNVFLEAMDEAALFPGGEEALAAACAKRAGDDKPVARAQAAEGAPERSAGGEAPGQLAKDGRIVLKAPPRDGEVRKPALAIDAALAGLNSLDAPVRNLNGRLAEIVKVPTPGLHLLTADDANSVGGERKLIEAPPEFTIREMTDARVGVVVEKYIRLEATTRDGRAKRRAPRFMGEGAQRPVRRKPAADRVRDPDIAPGLHWSGRFDFDPKDKRDRPRLGRHVHHRPGNRRGAAQPRDDHFQGRRTGLRPAHQWLVRRSRGFGRQ